LSVTCSLPFDEGEGHNGKVNELGGSHKTDKPVQDNSGVVGNLKEGEERND